MFLNPRILVATLLLAIASSTHCDLVQGLNPLGISAELGTDIHSVNWCTCQFLAAGGIDLNGGIFGIYQFDQSSETLSQTATISFGSVAPK